jgi:tryptophanyl-tRNA synthetase
MTKKTSNTVLTGDRPTGHLHLGHYVGSIENRIRLQNEHEKSFYMIADIQALTDNADNPEKVRSNVIEVALDNLASGVDPEKTTFFIQSQVPEIAELSTIFMNLVTVAELSQNPTIKTEMAQKGFVLTHGSSDFEEIKKSATEAQQKVQNVSAGFLTYPISQASDILTFGGNVVPVGEDQLPVIELTNDIVRRFNKIYGELFGEVEAVVSKTPRLSGIDGKAKMSKSLGNAIFLSDSREVVEEKVMKMYTDSNHLKVTDPGQVEGNVVFEYLDIFDPNKSEVEALKEQYRKGGLGDVVIKQRLIGVLSDFIDPIREKRENLAKDPKAVMKILEEGTLRARETAQETLKQVRQALKIDYFK